MGKRQDRSDRVRSLWWVTRPTRDLNDIEKSLESFAKIAVGKKWKGNRNLHQEFETKNPQKTKNSGKRGSNGSGGRTWAAWLKMWGMWYDEENVKLTDAGKLIISKKEPEKLAHNQIVHMIMNFQITSPYHENIRPKQAQGFRIFPFRFLLRLILDNRIRYLTMDEIGMFILQVKRDNEYEGTVGSILAWRNEKNETQIQKLKKSLIKKHMDKHAIDVTDIDKHWRSVIDVARTFAKNLSRIKEISYEEKRVFIEDKDQKEVQELYDKYENIPFIRIKDLPTDTFLRKYGMRVDRRKSSGKDTKPMTSATKDYARIKEAIYKIKQKSAVPVGSKLIERIQDKTDFPTKKIEKILVEHPELLGNIESNIEFADDYLETGKDGSRYREFEEFNRIIFTEMGFETKKHRVISGEEIDGLILNKDANLSGLLESKSGKIYNLTVEDRDKMSSTYIPKFKKKTLNKTRYNLDFFVYVVGLKFNGMRNFDKIINKTRMRGSIIYARDLLKLFEAVRNRKITKIKAWRLLKSNKHIKSTDIDDA